MNYDEVCKTIIFEFSKIKNPKPEDIKKLSKKLDVDISIVRDCIGLKDQYDFTLESD
tara:strand:- start:371 stop:541 length:171 start_codon:yes stop_codon:yes gene_type:complete